MDSSPASREVIAQEAADWFCRMQLPTHGTDERVAFSEWLTRSPLHIEEFLAISTAWARIDVPAAERFGMDALIDAARNDNDTAAVLEFRRPESRAFTASTSISTSSGATRRWIAAAAGILVAIGAGVTYNAWRQMSEFATAIGEQRSFGLADGSVVLLNTNSRVRIRWTRTERKIELVQGEARFQVAKNRTRPFIVATTEATVRAVGTIFNVMTEPKITQVTVIEGRVDVRAKGTTADDSDVPSKSTIELAAGENAAVDSGGSINLRSGPPVERVDAWTVRRLVFRDESLGKVVAEFNRYHDVPMVVDDPQLAALKINGVFDSNDPETLLVYLRTFETVQTHIAANGSLHLSIMPSVTKPER